MKKMKLGLLPRIIIAIALGIVCGLFFPGWIVRIFLTVNSLFGNFLNFIIPLLILGLVAPGIADLGKGAGRLLLITALLAYGFTLFSGFFTYFTCDLSYPWLLNTSDKLSAVADNTVACCHGSYVGSDIGFYVRFRNVGDRRQPVEVGYG